MKNNLKFTELYLNREFFIIPKNSFLCTFNNTFLNRQNNIITTTVTSFTSNNIFTPFSSFEHISNFYPHKLIIFMISPGSNAFSEDLPTKFHRSGYDYVIKYTNIKDLVNYYTLDSVNNNILYIFTGFSNWNSIIQQMFLYHNIIISGVDSSKRHYLSKLQVILLNHLLFLTNKNLLELEEVGIKYNLPKKLIQPNLDINKFSTLMKAESDKPHIEILKEFCKLHPTFMELYANFENDPSLSNYRANSTQKHINRILDENKDSSKGYFNENNTFTSTRNLNKTGLKTQTKFYSSFTNNKINVRRLHTKISNIQNRFNVYDDIRQYLMNNPLNNETQIQIEKHLLNHGMSHIDLNKPISGIPLSLYTQKTTDFILPYKDILLTKINRFMKNRNHYSLDNNSTIPSYYLAQIIDIVLPIYVVRIILGRFLKILAYNQLNLHGNKNSANIIMSDLGSDLLREYFYNLYLKENKKLLKDKKISQESDFTYSD